MIYTLPTYLGVDYDAVGLAFTLVKVLGQAGNLRLVFFHS